MCITASGLFGGLRDHVSRCAVVRRDALKASGACDAAARPFEIPTFEMMVLVCVTGQRFRERFFHEIHALAEDAVFREVVELPPEVRRFQAKARGLVEATRPSMDMGLEDEAFVLKIDNGDWEDEALVHWHVIGRCATCGGQPGYKAAFRKALSVSLGAGAPLCLLYRWKGFERGLSWALRAARQHNILFRIFRQMFTPVRILRAEEEAAAAQEAGDVNHGANITVRGGKVKDFLAADPKASKMEQAVRVNTPLQWYLNKVFKAEKDVRAYEAVLMRQPKGHPAVQDAARTAELAADALHSNLRIIDRSAAKTLQEKLSAYLRAGDLWQRSDLTPEQVFHGRKAVLAAAGSAYFRVDFRYQHVKYELLRLGVSAVSDADFTQRIQPLLHQITRCPECADSGFTGYMVRKCAAAGNIAGSIRALLRQITTVLPLSSIIVERKHLLGQETHTPKKRGRTPTVHALGARTYVKTVREASKRISDAVLRSVVGKGQKKSFVDAILACARTGRKRAWRTEHESNVARRKRRTVRKPSAYAEFRRAHWGARVKPGSPEEERRIAELWRQAEPAQREIYRVRAEALWERCQGALAQPAGHAAAELGEAAARSRKRGVTRQLAVQTVQQLKDHPAWRSGAALAEFNCGLRPDFVDRASTSAEIDEGFRRFFDFDPREVPNPQSRPAEIPCDQRHGGLCSRDEVAPRVTNVCNNLHRLLAREKVLRAHYPVLLDLTAYGAKVEVMLAFAFGRGHDVVGDLRF